jgi:hypothetical protein
MNKDEQLEPLDSPTGTQAGKLASQVSVAQSTGEPKRSAMQGVGNVRPAVQLHIEELVLNGIAPPDRYVTGEAFERELTRLLSEHGVPRALTAPGETATLPELALEVMPGASAQEFGAELAKAIYGGLDR